MAARKPKVLGGKTRSGKRLDPNTGKVVVPLVKRDEETGKLRSTTEAEKKAARTVTLPATKPVKEQKPSAPSNLPGSLPGQGPRVITKGAASGNYTQIKAAVDAARGHLATMAAHPIGSPEHHDAHQAFNAIHANIGKMSPELHTSLGQAKHFVTNPGKGSNDLLAKTHEVINTRLNILRTAHEENIQRAAAGRLKKAGN